MMVRRRSRSAARAWCAVPLLAALFLSAPAAAQIVDLELVLAVDTSSSVDPGEYRLQIQGIAAALRHPVVIQAIRDGAPNGAMMSLVQWAGVNQQARSPWRLITDGASAEAFALEIEGLARVFTRGATSISSALSYAAAELMANGIESRRQVVDVSGDGWHNAGEMTYFARKRVLERGIVINGLAILNDEPDLDLLYAERLIGGPGSFIVSARDFGDFRRAMRIKLIREIEGSPVARAPLPASDRAG